MGIWESSEGKLLPSLIRSGTFVSVLLQCIYRREYQLMEGLQWVYSLPEFGLKSKFSKNFRAAYHCATAMRQSSGHWGTAVVSWVPHGLAPPSRLVPWALVCLWGFVWVHLTGSFMLCPNFELHFTSLLRNLCPQWALDALSRCCSLGIITIPPCPDPAEPGTGNATAIPHHTAKLLQMPVRERTGKVGFERVLSAAMRPRLSQRSHGNCPCSLACNTQTAVLQAGCILPRETSLHPVSQIKHTWSQALYINPRHLWEGNNPVIASNTRAPLLCSIILPFAKTR